MGRDPGNTISRYNMWKRNRLSQLKRWTLNNSAKASTIRKLFFRPCSWIWQQNQLWVKRRRSYGDQSLFIHSLHNVFILLLHSLFVPLLLHNTVITSSPGSSTPPITSRTASSIRSKSDFKRIIFFRDTSNWTQFLNKKTAFNMNTSWASFTYLE